MRAVLNAYSDLALVRVAKNKLSALVDKLVPTASVGISRRGSRYLLKVNLPNASKKNVLPKEVDGIKVRTEVVGKIRKL